MTAKPSLAITQGGAGDAIDYALGHCPDEEALRFLDDWRLGEALEWPDYARWIALQRKRGGTQPCGHAPAACLHDLRPGSGLLCCCAACKPEQPSLSHKISKVEQVVERFRKRIAQGQFANSVADDLELLCRAALRAMSVAEQKDASI